MQVDDRNHDRKALWVAGCMSGTSLDGVDVALIQTDGRDVLDIGETYFRAYSEQEQAVLRGCLGAWDVSIEVLELIEEAHCEALSQVAHYDLIGFHGITFAHDPDNGRTFQAGRGNILAQRMKAPVIWDMRSHDVAHGGQGAPLAPFYHHAIAKQIPKFQQTAFLNLGGVGNISLVDRSLLDPAQAGALIAFDTGPANAPINDLMYRHFNQGFDLDGEIAKAGQVDVQIVERFLNHSYFQKSAPKSLDRNSFGDFLTCLDDLNPHDGVATASALCVSSVRKALELCPQRIEALYVCGGGRKNRFLMQLLEQELACNVMPIEAIGFDGDFIEAQAFAYLAARSFQGMTLSAPMTTGVKQPLSGGQLALP